MIRLTRAARSAGVPDARGCAAPRRCCRRSACAGRASANGSWKMICIRRRYGLSAAPVEPRDVAAVERIDPGRRLDEAQEEPPDGRLAAARLADEAERLAAPDLEASRRRRPARGRPVRCSTPPLTGKCLTRSRTTTRGAPSSDRTREARGCGAAAAGAAGAAGPGPAGQRRPRSSSVVVEEAADVVLRRRRSGASGCSLGADRRGSPPRGADAARREAAARRQVDEVRHVAGDDGELVADLAHDRDRADEAPRVRVAAGRGTACGRPPARRSRRRTSPRPGRTSRRRRRGRG